MRKWLACIQLNSKFVTPYVLLVNMQFLTNLQWTLPPPSTEWLLTSTHSHMYLFSSFTTNEKKKDECSQQGPCLDYNCLGLFHFLLLFIFLVLPPFICLLCPRSARLCHVFHYSTNVLVTVSLICESTRGKKQVREGERTRANRVKDERKENYL